MENLLISLNSYLKDLGLKLIIDLGYSSLLQHKNLTKKPALALSHSTLNII